MCVMWADYFMFKVLAGHTHICDLGEVISYFGEILLCTVHEKDSSIMGETEQQTDDPKEGSSHAPRSLLASNLQPYVSEQELREAFILFSPISTVHVCRDKLTRLSRGYGFITFERWRDAEGALEALF